MHMEIDRHRAKVPRELIRTFVADADDSRRVGQVLRRVFRTSCGRDRAKYDRGGLGAERLAGTVQPCGACR